MFAKSRYKQIQRVKEIFGVFIKYGFYNQLDQLGLLKYLKVYPIGKDIYDVNEILSRGERLRLALEELGPAFVKLGQILSIRREIIPPDVIRELENLQNRVAPIDFEEIRELVEKELEGSLEDLFLEFDPTALAAASIAQVHKAQLKSGKNVVVKVQRPLIQKQIAADVSIIGEVAGFLDSRTKYGQLYNFTALAKDFKRGLYKELDFDLEARNINVFRRNFKDNKYISFPGIYKEYCTKRVLTMDFIQGVSLQTIEASKKKNIDPIIVARRLSHSILEQILRDGFFHGDPHPGNIRVLPNNRIVFLDMGIVGKIGEEKRIQLYKIVAGITLGKTKLIVEGISEIGAMAHDTDTKELESEISILLDEYLEVPIHEIEIGVFLNEIFQLSFRHQIRIPNEFALIAKTLGIVEGTISKLDPELNIMEIGEPITKELLKELYSPKRIGKNMGENIFNTLRLTNRLPGSLLNILNRLEHHDIHLYLQFKNEEKIVQTLNKIANQLSFSVALLAMSIVIAGFIIGLSSQGTIISPIGSNIITLGIMAAIAMGIWLIISIIRTGRF